MVPKKVCSLCKSILECGLLLTHFKTDRNRQTSKQINKQIHIVTKIIHLTRGHWHPKLGENEGTTNFIPKLRLNFIDFFQVCVKFSLLLLFLVMFMSRSLVNVFLCSGLCFCHKSDQKSPDNIVISKYPARYTHTLHYTTLHYTTLHYSTLHSHSTLHYTHIVQYISLSEYSILHQTPTQYSIVQCLQYSLVKDITFQCNIEIFSKSHCSTVQYSTL